MLSIIKKYVTKKQHVFHASDNNSNQEVDIDVMSNVMTFLTSRIKVQTVHSLKRPYFHE